MTGVNIKVRADARQATTEMSRLSRSINSIDQQAKSVTSTFQKLAIGITAAFAAGGVTKGIVRASDSMTNMGNRVNLVTRDMKKTSAVMKELFSIAARSRSDVGAAADTFSRFGLALKDQNKPLKELLVVTEAVQKAGVISGSSTESAKAAIVQLGQGLASGQLRGQELNSVLEQMPRLAQAIAEGMGIPFGKLRESAMAGLVTAEAVYDAIIKGAQDIDDEYLLLKATVGGLSVVFKNEFTRAISEMDKVIGISANIKAGILLATQAVQFFGENISTWALIASTQFLLLETKIKFFVTDTKQLLGDLFTGKLDGTALADSVIESLDILKGKVENKLKRIRLTVKQFFLKAPAYDGFDNVAEVTPIDVSKGFITGFNAAVQAVTNFTATIADLFWGLWDAVVGSSFWTGIFDPLHEHAGKASIGNIKSWGKFLDAATRRILTWTNAITGLFSNLHGSVTSWWTTIVNYVNDLNLKETRLKGLEKGFDTSIVNLELSWSNFTDTLMTKEIETPAGLKTVETKFGAIIRRMKASWDDFYKYLTVKTVDTPQGQEQVDTRLAAALNKLPAVWDTTVNTMSTRWDEFYKYITVKTVNTPAGLKTVETNFAAILGRMKKALSNFSTKFDGAFSLTKEVETPGGTKTVDSDLVASVKESLKNAREAVQGVPIFVALKLVASNLPESLGNVRDSIIDFFDGNKNIISAAISFGLAVALSQGLKRMVLRGGIVGAFLLAAATLGNNAEFLDAANKTASGFGEALRKAFSGGTGEGTIAADIISGLGNITRAIGEGFVDGFFGPEFESDFVDSFATALTNIGLALVVAPRATLAMGKLGAGLILKMGGSALVAQAGLTAGAAMASAIAAGVAAAPFVIGAALLAAAGAAVVGTVVYLSNQRLGENEALAVSVGIAPAVERDKAKIQKFEAGIDDFINGIRENIVKSNEQKLSGSELVDSVFSGTLASEANALFDKRLSNLKLNDKNKLLSELKLAFPQFSFSSESFETAFDNAIAGGSFDLASLLKESSLLRDDVELVSPITVDVEETEKSLDEVRELLLNNGAAQAGELLSSTFDKISKSEIITNTQLTALESGSTAVDKLASSFDKLNDSFENITGFTIDVKKLAVAEDGAQNFSTGGSVSGPGTGTSDDIPAMLSNGEFVMKQSAVQKFGPDFMHKVNAGIMPQMFNNGGLVGQIDQVIKARTVALSRGDDVGYQQATKLTEQLKRLTDATEAQLAILDSGTDKGKAEVAKELKDKKTGKKKVRKTAKEIGEDYAASFENDFNAGLKQAFRDGDVKGFLTGILDSFTGNVIDSFVDGLTNSLFEGLSGEGGILSGFFENIVGLGGSITSKAGDAIVKGAKGGEAGEGLSGIFGGLTDMFSNLMSSLGDSLSGLMSGIGGGGGGGGLFSSIFGSTFGSIFGFSQGGIVPSTSTSQAGKDSVPAMLMPGEVVLSKNDVSRMGNNSESSTQQFNINVSGDVSRQTRKEIVKMIPQITSGVNLTNREKGAR